VFFRSVIGNSRSIDYTSRVIRMTILSDATTWSVTYDHHSDDYDIFIKEATAVTSALQSTYEPAFDNRKSVS